MTAPPTRSGACAGATRPAPSAARRSTASATRARSRPSSATAQAHRRARATSTPASETLAEFVEEWWHGLRRPEPRALDAARLRAASGTATRCRGSASCSCASSRRRRSRASAPSSRPTGVGIEAIRKTMTMLQGVLQRAVEWGRVPTNAVKLTRKPPKQHQPGGPGDPAVADRGHARAAARARTGCATRRCWSLLAYAGLRPQEALALEWRHVRERTLLVERALSDGQLKALKNRRQPRTVDAARAAARRPRRVARTRPGGRADRAGVPVARRRLLARDATGATGASGSTSRSPRRSASTAPARTTCATRSRRC